MSKNFQNIPTTKKIYINNQFKYKKFLKKKSKSQMKYSPIPDIITQMKPYINNINNFINSSNSNKGSLTPNSHSQLLNNELLLPKKSPEYDDKKTLVLDLDETLVHSSFTPFDDNDIVLNVEFDGLPYNIYVLVRPGAEYFINYIAKYYEIVIFTASLSNYASPLLDILDKNNDIKYRLFRENCTYINGTYIKDLKKLNRNLKDLVIVDNSPLAYIFDIDNGLPIKTWYEDKNDTELYKIIDILEFLSTTNDVRYYIKKFVKKNEILYDEALDLIKAITEKNSKKIKDASLINININNSVNLTNNLINTSNNNEHSANFPTNLSTSKKIFNIKKTTKKDENLDINIEPVSFLNKTNNIENKNDILEDEKDIIKNKITSDNPKKSLKATILNNNQNKRNILFPLNEIKKNNFFENKKINEKQRYKNTNIFRLKKKNEIKQNSNNIHIMSNINIKSTSKIHPIMPITLSTTNIKSFSFNTTKNLLLKTNKSQKKDDTKLNLKSNYIHIIQDKKEKRKYSNLLKQISNDNIKNNLDTKKIFNYEKFNLPNTSKSKLRVSSSIISHRNYTPLNKHQKKNKIYISFNPQRSKSSGHFFDKKNTTPRTPSTQILKDNERRKFDNLLEKIYAGNTTRYNNNFGKNLIEYKYRRIQTAKKLKN